MRLSHTLRRHKAAAVDDERGERMARIRRVRTGPKPAALNRTATPSKWLICVYVRLSREDTRKNLSKREHEQQMKSESIQNQKSILVSWIDAYFEAGSYEIVDFFEDDGLTGTDDTREGFLRMIGAVERGEANCIVVKTLSRAFRNYSDQGYYLEEYFPSRNIRFISTMDAFLDTYMDAEAVYHLDVPMYGVLNDRFAAATSRAVRKTFDDKRSKGKFIGAFPPWGFLKDPEDRNHLILDPDTAPIKIQMKDWLLREGMSLSGAAKRLNAMGIPNPTKYKQLKGWKYCNPNAAENDGLWCGTTVKNVLLSLMNLGHMVQGKQRVISYKIHDKVAVQEKDWFIVENTHEATFTQEEYDALCSLLARDTRTADHSDTVHPFAGLVKCGNCGKAMHRSHRSGRVYYQCRTRKAKSPEACPVRSIREDRLEQAVLAAVQAQIQLLESPEAIADEIRRLPAADGRERLEKLLTDKERELQRVRRIYDSLYGSWKTGELSETEYRRMRQQYQEEQIQIENAGSNIRTEISRLQAEKNPENSLLTEFTEQANIRALDRFLLVTLIEEIQVYEKNEITIHFRFEDPLRSLLSHAEEQS